MNRFNNYPRAIRSGCTRMTLYGAKSRLACCVIGLRLSPVTVRDNFMLKGILTCIYAGQNMQFLDRGGEVDKISFISTTGEMNSGC